jgi:hypothetical protein
MLLREVAVGFVSLVALGCTRTRPIVAAPTVVVVGGVAGEGLDVTTSAALDEGGPWKARDEVEVEWHGSWWPAVVLDKRGARWLVHYDGYAAEWDEVVSGDRIRERHVEPEVNEASTVEEPPDP